MSFAEQPDPLSDAMEFIERQKRGIAIATIRREVEKAKAERAEAVNVARRLVYEVEGGNRWPVEWSSEGNIQKSLDEAKHFFARIKQVLPELERNGPGWKRANCKQICAAAKEPNKWKGLEDRDGAKP